VQYAPILKSVFLFITARCNLGCSFCAVNSSSYTGIELSTQEILTTLSEARQLGCDYLTIIGGEPFLRNDLTEIVNHALMCKMRIGIATNGTLLRPEYLRWDKCSDLKQVFLGISLDGPTNEIHDSLRGRRGCFEETIKGLNLAHSLGIPLVIQTVLQESNFRQIDDISHIARQYNADHFITPEIMPKSRGASLRQANLGIEDILELMTRIHNRNKGIGASVFVHLPPALLAADVAPKMSMPCHWGIHFCAIMPNGDVTMCHGCDTCEMQVSRVFTAGNIRDSSLEDIWKSSQMFNALRDFDVNTFQGICGRCELRLYCRGYCRLRSYLEYGSLVGPEILCQRAYEAGLFPEFLISDE